MNMKHLVSSILFASICIFYSDELFAQTLDWAISFGGEASAQSYEDVGKSVVTDSDGNVYCTGYFQGNADFDPGIGNYFLLGEAYDAYVTKLDPSGGLIWAKRIGGSSYDYGTSISVDEQGNAYVAGRFYNTADLDPGVGVYNVTASGDYDVFIVKLDSNGNFVWGIQLGGVNDESINKIDVDSTGNIYVTGYFYGTADFDPSANTFNLISNGQSDVFIAKFNNAGGLIWSKQFGGSSYDNSESMLLSNENIYIAGNFYETANFDTGGGTFYLTSAGFDDGYLAKIDTSGNFMWAKNVVEGNYNGRASSIAMDNSGNIYVAGDFEKTADFDFTIGVNNMTSVELRDVYLSKMDSLGNFLWAKQLGGTNDDKCNSIVIDDHNFVYLTGEFLGNIDCDPSANSHLLNSTAWSDIYLAVLDESGNYVLSQQFEGSGSAAAHSITNDNNQNIYLTGQFEQTFDFDPGIGNFNLSVNSARDVFVLKMNMASVGLKESDQKLNFSIYPNPSMGLLNVCINEQFDEVKIRVLDSFGKVFTNEVCTITSTQILLPKSPGTYFIEIETADGKKATYRVVKL